QRRRHLVAQGTRDDHHVRLPRRGPRGKTEALGVVARGIDISIISIAQQASPKVIHIREPVRAQVIRLSAVTRKPRSVNAWPSPEKKGSSAMTSPPLPDLAKGGCTGCAGVVRRLSKSKFIGLSRRRRCRVSQSRPPRRRACARG